MNDLQIFKNDTFGQVRILEKDNELWFVAKDVADTLGYQNGSRDVNRHTDGEDRTKTMVFDGNQNKETILINESGLYSLVLSSKLPTAKQFKRWVTSEVIPQIRKTGTYSMSAQELNKILHEVGLQRKVGDQWILYKQHMSKGFTKSETFTFCRSDGR